MFPAFCPAYPSTHRNLRIQQKDTFRSTEEKDRCGHLHRQTQLGWKGNTASHSLKKAPVLQKYSLKNLFHPIDSRPHRGKTSLCSG